jgi:hypothetical protein
MILQSLEAGDLLIDDDKTVYWSSSSSSSDGGGGGCYTGTAEQDYPATTADNTTTTTLSVDTNQKDGTVRLAVKKQEAAGGVIRIVWKVDLRPAAAAYTMMIHKLMIHAGQLQSAHDALLAQQSANTDWHHTANRLEGLFQHQKSQLLRNVRIFYRQS